MVSRWIEPALNIPIKHEHVCYAPSCIGQTMVVFCIHVAYQTELVFDPWTPAENCRNMNQEAGKFCITLNFCSDRALHAVRMGVLGLPWVLQGRGKFRPGTISPGIVSPGENFATIEIP